jgi:hypothetical protein
MVHFGAFWGVTYRRHAYSVFKERSPPLYTCALRAACMNLATFLMQCALAVQNRIKNSRRERDCTPAALRSATRL